MVSQKLLTDRVSIITGGSMGIGKAIAVAFAREGSRLVLASRTKSYLEAAERELGGFSPSVKIFPTDVSQENEVKALVDFTLKEFGDINILVNCAGILGAIGFVTELDSKKWRKAIEINLFGTFLCIKAVLPTMIKSRRGKIINFSGGGADSPLARFSGYGTSKAAVVRLTETLAEEVKEYDIDINAMSPGLVDTRMLEQIIAAGEAAGKDFHAWAIKQKQDGGMPPEKVAELAVFLASAESDGLTGRFIRLSRDDWRGIPRHLPDIMPSDIYTLRRIVPKDRGYDW